MLQSQKALAQAQVDVVEIERDEAIAEKLKLEEFKRWHANEMEHLRESLAEANRDVAALSLKELVSIAEFNKWGTPKITVQFIDYSDHVKADRIKAILEKFAKEWPVETKHVDGSTLRPSGGQRITFRSANEHLSGVLSGCFSRGNWLGERTDWDSGTDGMNVLVTIFPKIKPEATTSG